MAQTEYSLVATCGRRSSRTWHRISLQFQALSVSLFLALFTCFTLSSTRGGAIGTTELFSGQCRHAVNINRVLQALLALLAIGVSVSSDFFIRLASSPTVDDLRAAHRQGRSLDIAVHSLRNALNISCWRALGWIMLVSLAVPIQIFSHSIAFVSFNTSVYSRLLVSEAFTTGQPFAYPGVALLPAGLYESSSSSSQLDEILPMFESASREWDRLESSDCRRIYSQDVEGLQRHRNLLVIIESGPDPDAKGWSASKVWNVTKNPYLLDDSYDLELENSLWSFAIYCEVDRVGSYNNGGYTRCSISEDNDDSWEFSSPIPPDPWGDSTRRNTSTNSWFSDPEYVSDMMRTFQIPRIKYCLSEPYSAPCKVYVSNLFLLVTTSCTLLGCICSTVVSLFFWQKETCQSLGDVLQVFLKDGGTFVQMPDGLAPVCGQRNTATPSIRWTPMTKWRDARYRWGQSISKRIWLWIYVPIGILLLGGSAALGALRQNISYDYTLGESLSNRIVYVRDPITENAFTPSNATLKLAVYCLIVNAPQLAVSSFYFAFSSLYSALFQAKYWADFSTKPQRLRVSFPHGEQQESTPALQFPSVWGLSFILLKASIGWSLTQSFYFVPVGKVSMWQEDFKFETVEMYVGYSMRAMILTIAIAAVAASIPLLLSVRYLSPGSAVVGTDSAAIAAHCPTKTTGSGLRGQVDGQHVAIAAWDEVWRSRRHLQPLRWGVLKSGSTALSYPGVLGLGTEDEVLGSPVDGQYYVFVAGHFKVYVPSALEASDATM